MPWKALRVAASESFTRTPSRSPRRMTKKRSVPSATVSGRPSASLRSAPPVKGLPSTVSETPGSSERLTESPLRVKVPA